MRVCVSAPFLSLGRLLRRRRLTAVGVAHRPTHARFRVESSMDSTEVSNLEIFLQSPLVCVFYSYF